MAVAFPPSVFVILWKENILSIFNVDGKRLLRFRSGNAVYKHNWRSVEELV